MGDGIHEEVQPSNRTLVTNRRRRGLRCRPLDADRRHNAQQDPRGAGGSSRPVLPGSGAHLRPAQGVRPTFRRTPHPSGGPERH